jgi:hypothetical protein
LLFEPIALSVHSAHLQGLYSTPSFELTGDKSESTVQDEIKASLEKDIETLSREAAGDAPVLKAS